MIQCESMSFRIKDVRENDKKYENLDNIRKEGVF